MSKTEKFCGECLTPMLNTPGIGPFCPNLSCSNVDGTYWERPARSAHRVFWEHHHGNLPIYNYDPTEDGPETVIIPLILASYPMHNPRLLTWFAGVLELRAEAEFLGWLAFKIAMERERER